MNGVKEFTFEMYRIILEAFISGGYALKPVKDIKNSSAGKCAFLRHDVDRFPERALEIARIENELGIKSTFYFKTSRRVFNTGIVSLIVSKGHEIGYHYNDYSACLGNREKAGLAFKKNLKRIRELYPVETICMHGSPVSPWNNKNLWQGKEYKELGINIDLFYDIDYNKIFYLTDNGFGWNRFNSSVRDKVVTKYKISIGNTYELIEKIKNNSLPGIILFNTHPDTFTNPGFNWYINSFLIKAKNPVKWLIVRSRILH